MIEFLPPLPLPPMAKRTIVVIDPSLSIRTVIAVTLRLHGFVVVSYAQPEVALMAIRQGQVAGPALVLLGERWSRSSLQRPAVPAFLDGWKTLRLLQQWELPLRVLLLLDEHCVLSSIEFQLAGACACLAKPFRIQQLLHLVQVYGRA